MLGHQPTNQAQPIQSNAEKKASLEIIEYKPYLSDKETSKKATFTVTSHKMQLKFSNMQYFEKGNQRWVAFSSSWDKQSNKYNANNEFINPTHQKEFMAKVLEALDEYKKNPIGQMDLF